MLEEMFVIIFEWVKNMCFIECVIPVDWCGACYLPLHDGEGEKNECGKGKVFYGSRGIYSRGITQEVFRITKDV